MAGLFESAVTAICISAATGTYNDACNKAVDAGTRQIGIRQNIDMAEDKTGEIIAHETGSVIGKRGMSVLGSGGFVYKVIREKSLYFPLPNFSIANSIDNKIAADSYTLNLQWKF